MPLNINTLVLSILLSDVTGGTIVLFDRKMLRNFRKDGHNWKKKKDGKTVKEAHEHLKVSLLFQHNLNICSDSSNLCDFLYLSPSEKQCAFLVF